jgi:hypothetical protein
MDSKISNFRNWESAPRSPQKFHNICLLHLPDLLYGRVVGLLNMDWPANYWVMLVPIPMFGRMGEDQSLTDCDDLPAVRKQTPIIWQYCQFDGS